MTHALPATHFTARDAVTASETQVRRRLRQSTGSLPLSFPLHPFPCLPDVSGRTDAPALRRQHQREKDAPLERWPRISFNPPAADAPLHSCVITDDEDDSSRSTSFVSSRSRLSAQQLIVAMRCIIPVVCHSVTRDLNADPAIKGLKSNSNSSGDCVPRVE